MLLNFLLIFGAFFTIVKCNCSPCGPVPKHYEELGCRGDYIDRGCCPDRFVCPDLAALDGKFCHINGKTYQKGETVSKDDSTPCTEDCVCAEGPNGDLKFVCAVKYCPEALGTPEKDCVNKYSLDQCCAVDKVCGEESTNLPQCVMRGQTFNYGEKFTAPILFAACHECICDENFVNNTSIEEGNKNCKKVNCGLQLRFMEEFKKGCTPIYYKDTKCCPIGFRCPSANDKIEPLEGLPDISEVKPLALCKFGELTLQRRQTIATDDKCIVCKCTNPPMIECIKTENCA